MKKGFSSSDTMTMLNKVLGVSPELKGKPYLEAIAKNIWAVFEFEYVFIGYAIKPNKESVQTTVALVRGEFVDNFSYELKDTPCEDVFTGRRVCIHERDVANLFPKDVLLKEMGVESYIGAPTFMGGELFGLVALLDSNRIDDTSYYNALVEFIASRVAFELERHITETKIDILSNQANTDSLTGLFNRNAFESKAKSKLINQPASLESTIMFIDADNFKDINDNYGHQKGDEVLKMIASNLLSSVREGDIVARFGGEEFVIFLPTSDIMIAEKVANRIHKSLAENLVHPVTVSIGVAIGKGNESLKERIKRADTAVYHAKKMGKNQTQFS